MKQQDLIVGIDLGTTNSAVAAFVDGAPVLVPIDGDPLLPSVVGVDAKGALIVGKAARNQYVLYPERTIRSVKRKMGEREPLVLGERKVSPEEVSAAILRTLKSAAEAHLGAPVDRAVITVPAYFSDAQRTATKEAGEIAGFRVEQIVNEPTAAALCYPGPSDSERILMVYDLGGGTFDVSIVRVRGQVTEVLASHGDTHLGGDDMDAELLGYLQNVLLDQTGVDAGGNLRALARLSRAAEEAKIRLSTEAYSQVREEHLIEHKGVSRHLDVEIARTRYEALIAELVERTKDSVQRTLRDAGLRTHDLDDVILVGGASRTPLVTDMLREFTRITPRADVNPDQAVALGAGLLAARLAGLGAEGILVDVTPFSFGTSYFGRLHGVSSPHCYMPVIHRNTPIPCRQTKIFGTMFPGQPAVEVHVYQGESEDARDNILIGLFRVEGLDSRAPAGSPIVFDCRLNLNGMLEVEVLEKHTGLKKQVTIQDAFRRLSSDEIADARARMLHALGEPGQAVAAPGMAGDPAGAEPLPPEDIPAEHHATWTDANTLISSASRVMERLGDNTDRDEVEDMVGKLRAALHAHDWAGVKNTNEELGDMLFYLE